MKKILVILACVAMLFSFASCNNDNGAASATIGDSYAAGAVVGQVFNTKSSELMAAIETAGNASKTVTSTSVEAKVDFLSEIESAVSGYAVDSAELTFSINKDEAVATPAPDPKSAITTATVNGKIVVINTTTLADYTVEISGNVDMTGSFTPQQAKAGDPFTVSDLDVTALSLPETGITVTVNGTVADLETVYKVGGIDSTEAQIKDAVDTLIGKINTALQKASGVTYAQGKLSTITLTSSDVGSAKDVKIDVTGTFATASPFGFTSTAVAFATDSGVFTTSFGDVTFAGMAITGITADDAQGTNPAMTAATFTATSATVDGHTVTLTAAN